ncbi:MAG: hypothetical protein LUD39_03260 [Opitutae bacterium]|nr:hypothetical protein [Opitutae bacterium]MCD8298759.1 hypothetical protein [Opitutae bacterium]
MKVRSNLFALASVLFLAPFVGAATDAANTGKAVPAADTATTGQKFDYIEQNGQKFVNISSINSTAGNDEFMRNVQVVNGQRQRLVALENLKKGAITDEFKTAADAEIAALTKRLDEDNRKMAETYGYSISRDYIHVPVVTLIYLKLTDEEYAKAKDDPEVKEGDLLVRENDKYRLIAKIPTAEENQIFRRNVQVMQARRENVVRMAKALESMSAGEQKDEVQANYDKESKQLEEDNKKMVEKYGFSLARDYLMEIEVSKLYAKVTEEEFLKAEAQAKLNGSSDTTPAAPSAK